LLDYWTFDDYFWSPSGRYLALYWMDPNSGQSTSSRNLVILNTQTLEAVDTCVQFSLPLDIPAPVWSPDETQILLNDAYLDNHQRVILVDLQKNIAFPIAEDMQAQGWMKSP
jgi:Tol biopolymer transport system component